MPAVALFEEAARIATLPPCPQPIAIADYGCAEGSNSLVPIAAALGVLRQRDAARSISVIHTDVPDNDFSALFTTLATDPGSYLRDYAVFASAVGRLRGCRSSRLRLRSPIESRALQGLDDAAR